LINKILNYEPRRFEGVVRLSSRTLQDFSSFEKSVPSKRRGE